MRKWAFWFAALVLLAGLQASLRGLIGAYNYQIVILVGISIILAVSLNLINGITGQFSIGHAGFYAIGAYVGAAWTMLWQPRLVASLPILKLGTVTGDVLNLAVALALGTVAAGLAEFVVGLPSL